MTPRVPQLELDNQLCFALYNASRAMTRAYGPILEELGLTYPQYLTMLALWEAGGPLTVGDLGGRLCLDSGTLTPLLKRLEQLGLVSRDRDPGDERRVLVGLTAAGGSLRERAADVPATILRRVGIGLERARLLRDQLTELAETLQSP